MFLISPQNLLLFLGHWSFFLPLSTVLLEKLIGTETESSRRHEIPKRKTNIHFVEYLQK